jgi:peptidoglycan/LPS O-acetylase OafA/YrhL
LETVHRIEANTVRFNELDSLRGLAACTVVLGHFFCGMGVATSLAIGRSPLRFLTEAHGAVILFFVLSGFVLALPYERSQKAAYWKFSVKRICRLYLPYLGALIMAVTMNYFYHGLDTNEPWINQTWSQKPGGRLIVQHVLFLGDYRWAAFNTAFWSLVYEMRISLIFPFLAIAVMRFPDKWMLAVAIASSLLSFHYYRVCSLLHVNPPTSQFADTFHYMSFFILGAILAKNREFIKTQYSRLPLFLLILVTLLAIALYYCLLPVPSFTDRVLPLQGIQDWATAFGSLIVIVLALYAGPLKKFLNHGAINYLGRISYSLYLVHGTVLFTLLYILRGHLTFSFIPVYLMAVLCLAGVFHNFVEKPAMVLGHKLAGMVG